MLFRSLKARIIVSILSVVILSLSISTYYQVNDAKESISKRIEEKALTLTQITRDYIKLRHKEILSEREDRLQLKRDSIRLKVQAMHRLLVATGREGDTKNISQSSLQQKFLNDIRALTNPDDDFRLFWIGKINEFKSEANLDNQAISINHKASGYVYDLNASYAQAIKCFGVDGKNALALADELFFASDEGFIECGLSGNITSHDVGKTAVETVAVNKASVSAVDTKANQLIYLKKFKRWGWYIALSLSQSDIEAYTQQQIERLAEEIKSILEVQKIGKTGYFFIFRGDGYMPLHPTIQGQNASSIINPASGNSIIADLKQAALNERNALNYIWDRPDDRGNYTYRKSAFVSYYPGLDWYVASLLYVDDMDSFVAPFINKALISFAFFAGIAIAVSVIIAKTVTSPVNELVRFVSDVDEKGIPVGDLPDAKSEEGAVLVSAMEKMITSIKEYQVNFLESELKYRSVVESLSDVLWELGLEGEYTYISPQIEKLSGYTPEEVIGKTPLFFSFNDDQNERVGDLMQQLYMEHKEFHNVIAEGKRKDGSTMVFEVSAIPFYNESGNFSGVRGISRDITDKVKLDQELKETEEEIIQLRNYLGNIIDSMPSILIGIDLDGEITLWNKTAENRTGISAEEAQNKHLNDVLPEMAEHAVEIEHSIQNNQTKRVKSTNKGENGNVVEDITVFPLNDHGFEGAVILIDDISDKVKVEEMMIQSEKMISIAGLAAGMAHEINNPLAGMMQTASVLLNRLVKRVDMPANQLAAKACNTDVETIKAFMEARDIQRMLEKIVQSGSRAAAIVNNMLSFSRKTSDSIASVDIVDLIEITVNLAETDYNLKKEYDFKQVKINREYQENLPYLYCHQAKIQQVIFNLLRNSAQAMHNTKSSTPTIDIKVYLKSEKAEQKMIIEVEDNGPGISENLRKRIFEPFFTKKHVGEGTGLGLSVSYYIIVDEHGGDIQAISAEGKGAKFIITLPLVPRKTSLYGPKDVDGNIVNNDVQETNSD